MSMLKFQNKVALVTGSGTGIGQTIAKKFIENGASVIILGRPDQRPERRLLDADLMRLPTAEYK